MEHLVCPFTTMQATNLEELSENHNFSAIWNDTELHIERISLAREIKKKKTES